MRNKRRNSILITRHTDLGSTCDWLNQIFDAVRPIRSSTQIWVVTRLQYGISALVSETSFGGETSGSVAKCRLFSQVNYPPKSRPRTVHCLGVVTYLNYHVLSCSCAAIPQNKIRQKYFERNVKQSVVIRVNDGGFLSVVPAGVEPALPPGVCYPTNCVNQSAV